MTLGFHDTAYFVEEGETIEICLSEINTELQRKVVVIVMSSDSTARGKYIGLCIVIVNVYSDSSFKF